MKAIRLLSMALTLTILFSTPTITIFAEENIKVVLNGSELSFDVPAQLINNRTMVPMRKIFEALGANVDWNSSTQTVTATKDEIVITMQIDNAVIKVNGKDITLDVPPQLVEGRTLVPVRAVAEGLNADVKWDEEKQTVIISKVETPQITPAPSTSEDFSEKLFSLIDNRLLVKMPEGTVDLALQDSIMSAPASNHEETMLMFEKNEEQLVLQAYELFSYSSGNIEDDVKLLTDGWSKEDNISYKYSKMGDENMQAMQVIPSSFTSNNGAILLRSALVKTNDNMLIVVNLYANPEKFKNKDNCFKLVDEIFDTLKTGTRTVETSAHKESIWLHSLEIEKGYVITLDRGPDFDVYHITKIVTLGENQPSMGIYIGGNPSDGSAPDNVDVKKVSDKILGKTVEWILYKSNDVLRAETVFNIPSSDYLMMHIFISAYDEKELGELKAMAQSLKSSQ